MRPEIYTISVKNDHIVFELREANLPPELLGGQTLVLPAGYAIVCRMGDPDLLDCIAMRHEDDPGGVFVVRNGTFLFAAVAEANLSYSIGLAYFGQMTANARYGVDIFDNLDNNDD